MTIMNHAVPNVSAEIARVAFSLFVHIADMEKSITAQEVRRFQVLLNDTSWIGNEDLKAGLADLKERYTSFWSNYEDGVFSTDIKSIAEALERVHRYIGDQRAKQLKSALGRFLILLDRGSFGVKLGQKDNPLRAQAKNDLAALLMDATPPALNSPVTNITRDGEPGVAAPLPPQPVLAEAAARPKDTIVPPTLQREGPVQNESPPADASTSPKQVIQAHRQPDQCRILSGKMKLFCVSATAETGDVKTYEFVGEPGALFHYQPGQAITIEVPIQGTILRRTYTISSSPSRPYAISITVKKVPLGWMSNWLFDNMRPGVECMASGPFGKFSCVNFPAEKLLFVAGGSGITPLMSMLRWIADLAYNVDVIFINNVKTPSDIIFQQELLHLSTRLGSRLRLSIIPGAPSPGIPWYGPTGGINDMLFKSHVPDLAEREVFVCGPPQYMAAVKSILISLGLPADRYHQEAFGPTAAAAQSSRSNAAAPLPPNGPVSTTDLKAAVAANPAPIPTSQGSLTVRSPTAQGASPPPVPKPMAPQPLQSPRLAAPVETGQSKMLPSKVMAVPTASSQPHVSIEGNGERFSAGVGQTILEAAEIAGVTLDHSCRSGSCGSCKMRKVSGEVEMEADSCLSDGEISAGYVLTCVGRPVGPVVLTRL